MTEPYRILITGTRRMRDPGPIIEALQDQLHLEGDRMPIGGVIIMHGAGYARDDKVRITIGCDYLANELMQEYYPHWNIEPHPAAWKRFGLSAGPRRNQEMIDLGPRIVLAFPATEGRTRGTRGTVEMAMNAGIRSRIYPVRV